MKFYRIILFLLIISSTSSAQNIIGNWRNHLSNRQAIDLCEADEYIYTLSTKGLFVYNTDDGSIEKIDKTEGLSAYNPTTIYYDKPSGLLFVGYMDGTLDIIKKDRSVINFYDIKRKNYIVKAINKIKRFDQQIYLCTDFGIVVFDPENYEFIDSYIIGNNGNEIAVYDMILHDNTFYVATQRGVRKASQKSPNLKDYNEWHLLSYVPYSKEPFNTLVWYNGFLYANNKKKNHYTYKLYQIDVENEKAILFPKEREHSTEELKVYNNQLFVIHTRHISIYNKALHTQEVISKLDFKRFEMEVHPKAMILDRNGNMWYADYDHGLVRTYYNDAPIKIIRPNSPYYSKSYSLFYSPNRIWSASGGMYVTGSNENIPSHFSVFSDGIWRSYSKSNTEVLGESNDILDVECSKTNPNTIYIASGTSGIFEFDFTNPKRVTGKVYTDTTEGVTLQAQYGHRTLVSNLKMDDDNNLWIVNPITPNPFQVKTADGKWYKMNYNLHFSNYGELIITQSGYKWALVKQESGFFVFHDRGTLDDSSDDFYKHFYIKDKDGQGLANQVFDLVEDKSGYIWLGTEDGIVIYYNPNRVEEGGNRFYGNKVLVDLNGRVEYLMKGKRINALAVDGANRKWIGTRKAGVFLVSEDGEEQLQHFTEQNSPLSSNNIIDITINEEDGTVYFSTEKGLDSFKGTATEGNYLYNDVYAYPNPVKHNYNGPIVIKGLLEDNIVKITDVAGNLVTEFQSKGGQAIWDGKNLNGNRVKTGVYLVFLSDPMGEQSMVTKILFIN